VLKAVETEAGEVLDDPIIIITALTAVSAGIVSIAQQTLP
jgi:hypothetical protein